MLKYFDNEKPPNLYIKNDKYSLMSTIPELYSKNQEQQLCDSNPFGLIQVFKGPFSPTGPFQDPVFL